MWQLRGRQWLALGGGVRRQIYEDGVLGSAAELAYFFLFSVFPLLKHALRTEGFFKIRGVNINHGDLEDFMFAQRAVTDFKAEAVTSQDLDHLRLVVEIARGADRAKVAAELAAAVKLKFEIAADVDVLESGTLAQEFEKSVKAPRFIDRRTAG